MSCGSSPASQCPCFDVAIRRTPAWSGRFLDGPLGRFKRPYRRMMDNFSGMAAMPSKMLRCCRRAKEIRDDNRNPETILEKAVAILADKGRMPDWFNQCPVASGITNSSKDQRRAIDLVHLSSRKARLVELKWCSNTPVYALFEVLEYGLAYVFARLHARELHLERRRLMQVDQVELEVVGPRGFFGEKND